jgi:hypothetical protein
MVGMGGEGEGERRGGEAASDEPHAKGAAPGKETLVEQMGGSVDSATAWGSAPRAATRIDTTSMGGADPFNFGAFSGGAAKKSSTTDVMAPVWGQHGRFDWLIAWKTDGTNGWIVQKITNTLDGTDKDGKEISLITRPVTPEYYEAWAVDSKGNVTDTDDAGSGHDYWARPGHKVGSKGSWSMRGEVYWTNQDPKKSGMGVGYVANAGRLLSSLTAPAALGSVLQVRNANGTWNSTGWNRTHAGTAK